MSNKFERALERADQASGDSLPIAGTVYEQQNADADGAQPRADAPATELGRPAAQPAGDDPRQPDDPLQSTAAQRAPAHVHGAPPLDPNLPLAPPREFVDQLPNTIDGTNIEGRQGEFLFTVGNVSSGKSTLQSFLIHRLWTDPRIDFEHAVNSTDQDGHAYLQGWVRNIANGLFPSRTREGNIREFQIKFGPAGRAKLPLNFIEIAGEDIRRIVPKIDDTPRQLNSYLDRYLREPGIRKRFIFVSDAESTAGGGRATDTMLEEDFLFTTLLDYLTNAEGVGLKQVQVLFVVTKWDRVKTRYGTAKRYFRDHFPQTLSRTSRTGRIRANFLPFSVGEVGLAKGRESGEDEGLILRKETLYIDYVISWLYDAFKGERLTGYPQLRPTPLQKLKNFFAGLV